MEIDFGNPASISEHTFVVDQSPCHESHLDILANYPFPEIEIEPDCDLEPQVDDFFSLFASVVTLVSLPDFFLYSGVNIESCTCTL